MLIIISIILLGPPRGRGAGRVLGVSVEPRYNLATKVMSNGVEVIVAGERNTRPGEPEYLRLLSSTVTRPITLAPHTLSHHMSMRLPPHLRSEDDAMASLSPENHFAKETFYTTYIYPTSVTHGTDVQTNTETTVVTNIKEINVDDSTYTSSQGVTITQSPVLESYVEKTVYTYLNTVMDADQPLVATSHHTVLNTVTASAGDLQPSEVFPETNTYYATRQFTKTLTDGTDSQVVSTEDVITQVVVTDPPETSTIPSDQGTIDVTKTYFVTYTYFSTFLEGDETKVTSHVSVSSDITVEQFFVKPKKTISITPTPVPLNIIITKTSTSTLDDKAETELVITETVPPDNFRSDYLEELSSKVSNGGDNPIVTSAVLKDGEEVEITAFKGDIIDEWYEKFKIKPTTEGDITKTPLKTKTTLKQKSKTKSVTKPSATITPTSQYSTSVVSTSTVTSQGATLLPGDQVIVISNEQGQTTMIPLSDPSKKKVKNGTEPGQSSDVLNLSALGINSMNVLGPVFNAMADLLKNHQKEALKKRNDTVPIKKTSNTNPLLSFMSGLKGSPTTPEPKHQKTTPRVPLYIPVGSFAEDSDASGSEGRISILPKPEKWVQERWPPEKPVKTLDKNRRTHDVNPMPLLEGGIPISPGQVITTNSDVIIGRPSDSGPRPPNFAVKNNVPVDMKPPPLEEQRVHLDPVGQFTTNQGVDHPEPWPVEHVDMKPPPLPPPKPAARPPKPQHHQSQQHQPPQHQHTQHHQQQHLQSQLQQQQHLQSQLQQQQHLQSQIQQQQHLQSQLQLQQHLQSQHQQQLHQQPQVPHHHPHDSGAIDLNPPPPPPNLVHQVPVIAIPVHLNPDDVIENYINPVHLPQDNIALPNQIIPTPSIPREISKIIDRSSGQALLVNIQPSQVAQVVIPQGSSTALIITDEQQHATKGEVIDDPSPHPEPETVGFVGAEPVLKMENSDLSPRPVNPMIEVVQGESVHHLHTVPNSPGHPRPYPTETVNVRPRPDYDNIGMKPPNLPSIPHSTGREPLVVHQRPHIPISEPGRPSYEVSKKDPSGIYVDISPPGHLPPPHNGQLPPGSVSKPQYPSQENLANHQSGVVHDVPLNVQVQLGSGHPADNSGMEVLVSVNEGSPGSGSQEKDDTLNLIHRPLDDTEDLSPPPLPRPPRPSGSSQETTIHGPRFPQVPQNPPKYPYPEPADFMIPPPKPAYGNPMVIPVGAGANQNYKPSRPGEVLVVQTTDYSDDDLDAESDDPLKTEDGEEIQESNSRPLLPGQLPKEVQKLLHNHTSYPINTDPSNIGVSQTLSFGNKNDKPDDNNPPGVREPETIFGSHMPSIPAHTGFGNNNEAVVSVGSNPTLEQSEEMSMDEAEKLFGMKLPPKSDGGAQFHNSTKSNEVLEGRPPVKMEEVMGMSPPPLETPHRPHRPSRPKPPFKFEMPSAPEVPISSVNLENDFPPVRSPDKNKKPFKPEDVFPPRLPENFVHHEHERPHRRPSVTSMPIDSPTTPATEVTTEINGHSKPLIPNNSTTPITSRPKPEIFERPPHIHMQKPTSRPPVRTPPTRQPIQRPGGHDHQQPPRSQQPKIEIPSRGQPDSSKRGQTPFPFEKPPHIEEERPSFGDKMRNPPRGQPPRGQVSSEFDKANNISPGLEETPSTFEQPPPPQTRPSPPRGSYRPNYELPPTRGETTPPRQPPMTFERPPPRRPPPTGFEQPPPSGFEQPPRHPAIGFDYPPSRQPPPSDFEQPPPSRQPPPHRGPPPSGGDRSPSDFEQPPPSRQPPHRGPPTGADRPPVRGHRPTFEPSTKPPPVFEQPPRVEPSPHFEGRPAQGHTHKSTSPRPIDQAQPNEASSNLSSQRKPPPAYHRPPPRDQANNHLDQQSQPTTLHSSKNPPAERNETPNYQNKPPPTSFQSTVKTPSLEESRPTKQPPRGRPPPHRPTPTAKPPALKPQEENIRPTPTKDTENGFVTSTPHLVTSMVTSGSTTIFGDLYTDPLLLQPTGVVTSNHGIRFTVSSFPSPPNFSSPQNVMVVASAPIVPTHSTTLTVTTTMTTVVHSMGQTPVTRTVVLTTTIISTIVDKVTETETLMKPTTATVTQTHTISTTKTALVVPTAIYPPRHKYPAVKPEIFVADPHEKPPKPEIFVADPHEKEAKPEIFVADPRDKDTITISVSSSMNKKPHKDHKEPIDNESILVVVTDKPPPHGVKPPSNVVLGGILSPPVFPHPGSTTECLPECRATRNELCIKQEGLMKCVCRPGFARMFPDQPCKPTYTYSLQMALERMGGDAVQYQNGLHVPGSPKFMKMAEAAKEGVNRMVMQSDIRDIYHGVAITGFQPKDKKTMVDFYVQLSENIEEGKVMDVFKKSLRSTNYSLGGTEMFAARESDNIHIQDFNECLHSKFHDCSEHSRCFNLKGTYTCSCKEGFTDISENPLYPGRLCSDMIGCEYCGYHGTCYTRNEQQTCECFQWYTGDRCRINLKVLLIALVTIGAILLALLLVCVVMTCIKRRSSNASRTNGSSGYLRYRGPPQSLDKRAMIVDTSSESSVENLPYVNPPPPPPQPAMGPPRKPVLRQVKRPAPRPQGPPPDQRDRSLTVMIPRVKYRAGPPMAPVSPHLTMSTFSPDKHLNRTQAQIATEQKLLSYLDVGPREGPSGQQMQRQPSKEEKRIYDPKPSSNTNTKSKELRVFEYEYKTSNMNITDGTSSGERRSKDDRFRRYSDQTPLHHEPSSLQHRKYSAGALVSAGYAVSATGGMIQDIEESTIHSNTLKSNRSQFTTLNRSGDHKTMSEARSYDETLIQPQTRPLCTNYSGSSSSRLHHDENHTMVERDLGSTFHLPESHLFKPAGDRGSDISNFDSL